MNDDSLNNKRIAKNTLMLYIRMLLTLGVSLYTSRVVLQVLGVEDYGIYNVVGGVIVLFSFLNGALTQATQRFLTYELGQHNMKRFKQIFSISLLVYLGLSIIIVFLSETIGLWFLNTHLNISEDKMMVANWVYQLTIITFFLNIMCTPYNAAIIAHERMSFYAYISIVEVVLKLLVVFLLILVDYNKLATYAVLISLVALIILSLYVVYCVLQFDECKYTYYWEKQLFMKLISFSGWSMFGSISAIATSQGVNMLLNIFFGVIVNAAMGITNQVSNAINQLVVNFQMAFNPQITKSYAKGDREYWETLVFQAAKISYLLLLFVSLPFLIKTDIILHIWLEKVPQYTVEFCQLTIIALLIDTLSGPLWMLMQANGRIKKYQLIVSSIFLLNFCLSYLLIFLGYSPVSVLIVRCIICCLLLVVRLLLFVSMLNFPSAKFCREVILRVILVTLIAFPLPCFVSRGTGGLTSLVITVIISFLSTSFFFYLIGLSVEEKRKLKSYFYYKMKR